MTIINPKSIAGVTSITTPSGSDNLFTVHTNNTTERVRINNDGDVIVGSGITVSPDGDIFATGVTTSTTFVGALTGNVTGNATGLSGTPNISVGTIAGSTGTFTGDVDIADKIVHTGDTDTAIRFSGADTIQFETGGSSRLQINSSGHTVAGGDLFADADLYMIDYLKHTGDTDTAIRFPAVNTFTVETAGSERIRIDSDGRVMIGQTSSVVPFMVTATASNFGGMVMTGVLGDATSYASGVGGGLTLSGKYNSGGSQVGFAAIRGLKENGTDGNYNGALTLNTRPNGGNMTERFRINSSGQVMIGTDTPTSNQAAQALTIALQNSGNTGLTLRSGTGGGDTNEGSIFYSDATSGAGEYAGYLQYSHASNYFRIGVNGTERTRINNVGEYLFGCTSTPNASVAGATIHCDPSPLPVYMVTSSRQHGANAYTHFQFFNTNGAVGQILINGSGTSYNTSSDYRLKENETAITDGITRLKQLKPYRFNFKADSSTVLDGFFAHEVSSVVPEAASGEKDAVATESNVKSGLAENVGDIIPQGLDNAKLVPLLTAALQESVTKIEVLETRLNNAGIAT